MLFVLLYLQVEELEEKLSPPPFERPVEEDEDGSSDDEDSAEVDKPIATWSYCNNCKKVVTPLVYISESTWSYSFGKFLESFFYNRDAIMNAPEYQCSCGVQSSTRLYFGCGKLAARFDYEPIRPYNVFVRRNLPMEMSFQKEEALRRLELVSTSSSKLFAKFEKHIERVAREARSLFNSPANRPDHLQTVLMELKRIGSDVAHAAKTLNEKIASVTESCRQQDEGESINDALYRFPWFARRYLFMITFAWNEKLSATGEAITAMKKIAASASSRNDGGIGSNVAMAVGDPASEALMESMKRLRKLNEQYAKYTVTDITEMLPALPGTAEEMQQDGDYEDDEFIDNDPDTSIDFSDGVDADVLASRRRLLSKSSQSTVDSRTKPTKSLGTRRPDGSRPAMSGQESVISDTSVSTSGASGAPMKSTAGGAVKSAITRFFNRGGREYNNYTVHLGIFAEGRPRLVPGMNGVVVPVFDEQLSSIVAYSLSSIEYNKQFQGFSKQEAPLPPPGANPSVPPQQAQSQVASGSEIADKVNGTSKSPEAANSSTQTPPPANPSNPPRSDLDEVKEIERRMLVRSKHHVKHTFRDFDAKGQVTCKFVCTTYWATQFQAVRQVFLSPTGKPERSSNEPGEVEQNYVESLSSAYLWDVSG